MAVVPTIETFNSRLRLCSSRIVLEFCISPEVKFRCRKVIDFCILFNICSLTTIAQPATPKFQAFQPLTITNSTQATIVMPGRANPLIENDPYREQNYRIMRQGGMTIPDPSTTRLLQFRSGCNS